MARTPLQGRCSHDPSRSKRPAGSVACGRIIKGELGDIGMLHRLGLSERAKQLTVEVMIGLIDGVFHQSLAVTPAEVREAANAGVRLFGGASMGALRACECPHSMVGIGEIWSAFARGDLTDDDEVAVTFVPDTHQVIAYPLVQIREATHIAAQKYPACRADLTRFVALLRRLPFQERSLDALRSAGAILTSAGLPWPQMEHWLTGEPFDVKRRDALAVVAAVEKRTSRSTRRRGLLRPVVPH